ncbi:MAG: quaternary ammonium compound efflux SMR transporter SugE [Planctomycetes bacterium]|nr:quaternary ammonium compound efflux SMR transporter SugE [Planctomycetota bacterium]
MAWIILIVAGLFETAWAIGLKYTHGFTRPWPSALTIAAIVISMYLLEIAARTLPIGTAYAVWVGIGAAGTAILGVWLLNEPVNVGRVAFLVLMIVSIVGLKLTAQPAPAASM